MNYVPFTFVKSIHEAQHGALRTYQHRYNDGLMPQLPLMPDPLGLLLSQIHSAIDRAVARTIQGIFHLRPARQEAGTHNLPVERKPQPLASAVAKQIHTEVICTETEKKMVSDIIHANYLHEKYEASTLGSVDKWEKWPNG